MRSGPGGTRWWNCWRVGAATGWTRCCWWRRFPQTVGHAGTGDFLLDGAGRIARAKGQPGFVYLGAQIIRTDLLPGVDEEVFSLNLLWDRMIAAGRAYAVVHQGRWCDVGRPEGIAVAEAMLADG